MARINFKALKARVNVHDVLKHLGRFEHFTPKKGALYGPCPINDPPESRGKPFKVTEDGNAWYCFACKQGGNVLDLVMAYKGVPLREAAETLVRWLPDPQTARDGAPTTSEEPTNVPLTFELKLDREHPFFAEIGVSASTVEAFGAGYAARGLMKGTIAFPIHNEDGDLVAYAGRSLEDSTYRYPTGFDRCLEVFNVHRVRGLSFQDARTEILVIADDPLTCLRAAEAGLPRVVALIDPVLSLAQQTMLARAIGDERSRVALLLPSFSAEEQMAIVEQLVDLAYVTRIADLAVLL